MPHDFSIAVVTGDPYFLFSVHALLGRDRRTRIHGSGEAISLKILQQNLKAGFGKVHVVICDLDSIHLPSFYEEIGEFTNALPNSKLVCLSEGLLPSIGQACGDLPIQALLAKSDIGYYLHVVIHVICEENQLLVSEKSKLFLRTNSAFYLKSCLVGPEIPYPALGALSKQNIDILYRRIFVNLDNADISDEMVLTPNAVRTRMSELYEKLGVSGERDKELALFNLLSDWARSTRFEC